MSGKDEDGRFRHPETAAYLRSLTAEEAARHGPMIRRDGDGFLEYRIEDGEVRCRRGSAGAGSVRRRCAVPGGGAVGSGA